MSEKREREGAWERENAPHGLLWQAHIDALHAHWDAPHAPATSRTCFCAIAASNCACISSSLACTLAMRSSAAFFSFVATFSSASASRSLAILGSTTCVRRIQNEKAWSICHAVG